MACQVSEVMNREVLRFERDVSAQAAWAMLLKMGLSTAPVVDGNDHPIGVVSVRWLAAAPEGTRVGACMRAPAVVAEPEMSLLDAARLLDEANLHHLAVVGPDRSLIGFVSSLDLLRGIIGAPARHPDSFVHWDEESGAAFSNDLPLDAEHVGDTPHEKGLVVIVRGGAGRPERVVWAETTLDVKRWLMSYLEGEDLPELRPHLAKSGDLLRFRYAQIDDWRRREEVAFAVREHAQLRADRDARE